jgi:predicted GNAT family acetyltransferase
MTPTVVDVPGRSRFELRDGDRVLGFTEYHERDDGALVMPHTVVTEPRRGAGYGSILVGGALDDLRERGRRIVAECPFVARFVHDHPEYSDLLAD